MLNTIFRPIHYLGSKLRILDAITTAVDDVDASRLGIIDLFAGTGIVAHHLSSTRPVLANDAQEYSKILSTALLCEHTTIAENIADDIARSEAHEELHHLFQPLISSEASAIADIAHSEYEHIADFLDVGSLFALMAERNNKSLGRHAESFKETLNRLKKRNRALSCTIALYYGGVYFSFAQAVYLDACLNRLTRISKPARIRLHAAILSTASSIVNTIGKQFAQPITPRHRNGSIKEGILRKVMSDRTIDARTVLQSWVTKYNAVSTPLYQHKVLKGDFRDAFKHASRYSTVYADPPYTRYHYSRYYHVLETIALLDTPNVTPSNLPDKYPMSKGVYRADRFQSAFSIQSKAMNEFEDLFRLCSAHGLNMILSYSPYAETKRVTPRVVSVANLLALAAKYFSSVETLSCGNLAHSKLTRTDMHLDASNEAELLIVGRQ